MPHSTPILAPATIRTKQIYTGVTALARETGLSQPYVSKLLARGYRAEDIRQKSEPAAYRREVRAWMRAERERFEGHD